MKRFQISIKSLWLGLLLIAPLLSLSGFAKADEQSPGYSQQGGYAQNTASRIQVLGNVQKMSLDAEHADVLSVLKAVLKQGQKMFAPDATVTGQVTLSLTDLSLDATLKEICEQNFLKYRIQDNIYRFSRDEEAIKTSFTKLKTLNSDVRIQLRTMGIEFPEDSVIDLPFSGRQRSTQDQAKVDSASLSIAKDAKFNSIPTNRAALNGQDMQKKRGASGGGFGGTPLDKVKSARKELLGDGVQNFELENNLASDDENFSQKLNAPVNGLPYNEFIQRNRFVSFDIPREKPSPVSTVLQQLGQQANVSVYVDQSIPNSLKFRLWGHLSPRQLPDALNAIAPAARLQWRWSGNSSIYVVPAPDFQIAFGDNAPLKNGYQGSYILVPSNTNRAQAVPLNGGKSTNGSKKP